MSRSVAFVTLAQANQETGPKAEQTQPMSNPNADTLVYYMGRKDAAKIAQQLLNQERHEQSNAGRNHHANTPVHVLEAVSTKRERHWSSTLGELAKGAADAWFDSSSPALIMVGEALRDTAKTKESLESSSSKIHDGLQNSQILPNGRRCA